MGRVSSLEVLEGFEPAESDVHRIAARREVVEVLRARLDLLGSEDRVLLRMHLDAGSSFDEIAKLTGTESIERLPPDSPDDWPALR